jgi:hypothetical protein
MLMVLLLPIMAQAEDEQSSVVAAPERLGVVVREGSRDSLTVTRLRGQLADLDGVALEIDAIGGALEPTLEGQLAAAERVGAAHDARVVVWFVSRGRKLAVAIATPRDHRLFVREIPPAAESAMAEAAAIAVRGAVRSISLGGMIGIEVKVPIGQEPVAAVVVPVTRAEPATAIEASLGWQVAIDGGAARGAHALVQRTTLARAAWAASLTITLGVPLEWRAADDVALDVARSGALAGAERRLGGGLALGIGAGAIVYHRSTSTAPPGLAPTPSKSTIAFAAAAELAWRAPLAKHIAVVVSAGVDLVIGAPEAAISRDSNVEVVDAIGAVQPRASLALEVGSW